MIRVMPSLLPLLHPVLLFVAIATRATAAGYHPLKHQWQPLLPGSFPNLGVTLKNGSCDDPHWRLKGCTGNQRGGMMESGRRWGLGATLSYALADFTNSSEAGPWELNTPHFAATVSRSGNDSARWELALSPTVDLAQVIFPMLNGTDMDEEKGLHLFLPHLGGVYVRDTVACPICNLDSDSPPFFLSYPGELHSPYVMLCTVARCLMAAAVTWPPHSVRPWRNMCADSAAGCSPVPKLHLEFLDGYAAGTPVHLSILLKHFDTDEAQAVQAWQAAILGYRDWLRPHLPPPIQSERMTQSSGMLCVALENSPVFITANLNASWTGKTQVFGSTDTTSMTELFDGRLQFWGQMSNYVGDGPGSCSNASFCPVKLFKGEVCDCCADNYTMHARYLTNNSAFLLSNPATAPGLQDWVKLRCTLGDMVGYYTQVDAPTTRNLTWIANWLETNRVNYSANAVPSLYNIHVLYMYIHIEYTVQVHYVYTVRVYYAYRIVPSVQCAYAVYTAHSMHMQYRQYACRMLCKQNMHVQ